VSKGFNAVTAPDPASLGSTKLEYVFNGKIVQVSIESVSLGTFDAIMAPAESAASLRCRVFDRDGRELYVRNHTGQASDWLGITVSGEKEGAVVANAAASALNALVSDSAFLESIR
jgi:hypothetical protein